MESVAERSARQSKAFAAYMRHKCLIGYGVVNGVINAVIFYLLHNADPSVLFTLADAAHDVAFTGLLLGPLLFACVVPLTKMDRNHGAFKATEDDALLCCPMPRSYGAAMLLVGLVCAVAMTGACTLAMQATGSLGLVAMTLLKGVLCAAGGALSGYLTLSFCQRHRA
ncbi:hypothetical protein AAK967_08535 [Atopobiaceae bacterium 24-176]